MNTTKRASEDFGFSLFTDTEMQAQQPVVVDHTDKERLAAMKAMIMTLMNNLLVDPEKVWLKWPNRVQQAQAFIEKLNRI